MSSVPNYTGVTFSVLAIVHTIFRAVILNSYGGECQADPATIARLALPLQEHIRYMVNNQILRSTTVGAVDWEAQILLPVIANFNLLEDIGVASADAEYIVLLASVIILAHEILAFPDISSQHSSRRFLVRMFDEYFCEPEICRAVLLRVEEEQRRLVRSGADQRVHQAVGALCELMPNFSTRAEAWSMVGKMVRNGVSAEDAQICHCSASSAASAQQPPSRLTDLPQDLRIEIFLKPGGSMIFDCMNSVDTSNGALTVKTYVGLRMHVEPGYTISNTPNSPDAVTLHAMSVPKGAKHLAATIIIPPGYMYRITGVEVVSEIETDLSQTLIETERVFFNVSSGDYAIQRRNQRRSVLIKHNG